jgi:hypothetical protein
MLHIGRHKDKVPPGIDRKRPLKPNALRDSHRRFQWKYTIFLLVSIVTTVAVLFSFIAWNLLQNYDIFKQLAFDTNPELVQHLEREVTWFAIFLAACFVAVAALTLFIGLRMTKNMVRPLIHLERHMLKVTHGDWSSEDFQYSGSDELTELFNTYSYLYRSLRAQTLNEIKLLEKLMIDPNNREAVVIWKQLINTKRGQLHLPAQNPNVSTLPKSSEVHEPRRAS